MVFFEFFFSGPGWGWKLFGLIVLITVIGDVINKAIESYFDYKVEIFRADLASYLVDDTTDTEETDNNATLDDFKK